MRKESKITIHDGDMDKEFVITQMGAVQADKFVIKLGLLLAKTGISKTLDIGSFLSGAAQDEENFIKLFRDGLVGLGKLSVDEVTPVLDELTATASRKVQNGLIQLTPEIIDSQIEELSTLWKIRAEAFKLNMSFFKQGGNSKSPALETAKKSTSRNPQILVKP